MGLPRGRTWVLLLHRFPVSAGSVEAGWPGWVCATARALLTPELALQGLELQQSISCSSTCQPHCAPHINHLEPQGGFAARILLWQLSRVSAAQGSPRLKAATRAGTFHIHNKSPWSLGLASGSVLSLPVTLGVVGGAASGQSSQDHIQGLCLVMPVLQKTPFAGVSNLLSDIDAISVKSGEMGLQQAASEKREQG